MQHACSSFRGLKLAVQWITDLQEGLRAGAFCSVMPIACWCAWWQWSYHFAGEFQVAPGRLLSIAILLVNSEHIIARIVFTWTLFSSSLICSLPCWETCNSWLFFFFFLTLNDSGYLGCHPNSKHQACLKGCGAWSSHPHCILHETNMVSDHCLRKLKWIRSYSLHIFFYNLLYFPLLCMIFSRFH